MCLAIPGKVLSIERDGSSAMASVDFGGVRKSVSVDWIPDLRVGEYVIVHVGCAISKMDESEALATLKLLTEMGEIERGPERNALS